MNGTATQLPRQILEWQDACKKDQDCDEAGTPHLDALLDAWQKRPWSITIKGRRYTGEFAALDEDSMIDKDGAWPAAIIKVAQPGGVVSRTFGKILHGSLTVQDASGWPLTIDIDDEIIWITAHLATFEEK